MMVLGIFLSAKGDGILFLVLVRILHTRWHEPEVVFGPPRVEREMCLIRSEEESVAELPKAAGSARPRLTAQTWESWL